MIPKTIVTSERAPENGASIFAGYIFVHPDNLEPLLEGLRAIIQIEYKPEIFTEKEYIEWLQHQHQEKPKADVSNKKLLSE
jgi:hypothetical protein